MRAAIIGERPPEYERSRKGQSWMRPSRGSGAAAGVSGDACDGDRGAHRMGPVGPAVRDRVVELQPAYLPQVPGFRSDIPASKTSSI